MCVRASTVLAMIGCSRHCQRRARTPHGERVDPPGADDADVLPRHARYERDSDLHMAQRNTSETDYPLTPPWYGIAKRPSCCLSSLAEGSAHGLGAIVGLGQLLPIDDRDVLRSAACTTHCHVLGDGMQYAADCVGKMKRSMSFSHHRVSSRLSFMSSGARSTTGCGQMAGALKLRNVFCAGPERRRPHAIVAAQKPQCCSGLRTGASPLTSQDFRNMQARARVCSAEAPASSCGMRLSSNAVENKGRHAQKCHMQDGPAVSSAREHGHLEGAVVDDGQRPADLRAQGR